VVFDPIHRIESLQKKKKEKKKGKKGRKGKKEGGKKEVNRIKTQSGKSFEAVDMP